MIIYFEDGSITDDSVYSGVTGEELIKINAGSGLSANYNKLVAIEKERAFNTRVYTNSIVALSNRWCWDEENKIPQLYIRNSVGKWENITHFTNREIRYAHNLEKMYMNGEFDIFSTQQ